MSKIKITNLKTQQEITTPSTIGSTHNVTWENGRDLVLAAGGRIDPGEPVLQDGYARVSKRFVDADGVNGMWAVVDRLASEIESEQATARKEALAAQLTPGLIALASAYRTALRAIGGEGAETNRVVTKDAVIAAMMQAPVYDAKAADLLKTAFEEITKVTGTDETWTFFETVGDLIP